MKLPERKYAQFCRSFQQHFARWSLGCVLAWVGVCAAGPDFNREVRPIISDVCFACHGPDDQKRKGGLRLDVAEGAFKGGKSGKPAINAAQLGSSEILQRILSKDPDHQMPPPDSGRKLSSAQVETLKRWIESGGKFAQHWAFTPPAEIPLPAVKDSQWVRNPIDRFALELLEKEKRAPRPEADKSTLLRRVTLDLTGLPPTLYELDAFLNDSTPEAYEKAVERCFNSVHHGERMAVDWLDTARFADTHGYHIDSARDMTMWRDRVIQAFNENQRFDQFTIEQLAGDLLPNATPQQRLASGFNRNHMINYEGGAIPEEYHAAYIHDRVNTTATAWLGLTMACAQCHDHKYDPISQRDYYRFYALFNTIDESGLDGRHGNAKPVLKRPSPAHERELERRRAAVKSLEARLESDEFDAAQRAWEGSLPQDLQVWQSPVTSNWTSYAGAEFQRLNDGSYWVVTPAPDRDTYRVRFAVPAGTRVSGVRLEVLPDDRLASRGPGRSDNGNIALTDVRLTRGLGGEPLPWKAASAEFSQEGYPVANAIDSKPESAWAILPQTGKSHKAIFELATPLAAADAGSELQLQVEFDFGAGFLKHQPGRVRVSYTVSEQPARRSLIPNAVQVAARVAPERRSPEQVAEVRKYYRQEISSDAKALKKQVDTARRERDEYERDLPSVMVMGEMEKPRDTFMLIRGDYDKKGEKVTAGTPAFLPPLPANVPANRLALAQWIVSHENPLTARVVVNRYWQMLFGVGLVKSSENFGSQADNPSHPELLDWLAKEFVRTGWDVRAMLRTMVTSATYRQTASAPRDSVLDDPENRLLGRGPRFRLQAEAIRDVALHVSGLLRPEVGGSSVFPYQPAGLWEELMSRGDNDAFTAQKYVQDHGEKLYRRSMYTFWKRTSAPATLTTFDAPDRQVCTVRRPRTNTPLQALALLNDPTFVEAARKLAERMVAASADNRGRIAHAFRLATARQPSANEVELLHKLYEDQLRRFRGDEKGARRLLSVGESSLGLADDPVALAAWTMVASAILNLDETVTKG